MSADADLPPGQVVTSKFPVVGESAPAAGADPAGWRLTLRGLTGEQQQLSLAELLQMGRHQRRADIHCVTGWSRRAVTMQGLPLADLLAPLLPQPEASFVRFIAHSARRHDTSLPLELALHDTWIVHSMDGQPLSSVHGGPLRSVTPSRYFYKSLKWLTEIQLLAEDQLGYWERESAYHNEADPLRQQRFDEHRMSSAEQVAEFRAAGSLDAWRNGPALLKARLGGWSPTDRNLSGLALKYCSLREAKLADTLWQGANLSLSNLAGADLRNASFIDADPEGADFSGCDLRGARIERAALSATRFCKWRNAQPHRGAQVQGLELQACRELLDEQRIYLSNAGATIVD